MSKFRVCPLCGTAGKDYNFVAGDYDDEIGTAFICDYCGYEERIIDGLASRSVDTSNSQYGVWPEPKELWSMTHNSVPTIKNRIEIIIDDLQNKTKDMYKAEDGTHPTSVECIIDYLSEIR